jgi:hypothetical protein
MTETDTDLAVEGMLDELGTIDYVVIEFPADKQNFSGEVAQRLEELIERKLVRIFDLVLIEKGTDGSFRAIEIDELEDDGNPLRAYEAEVASLLAEADLANIADAIEPGSIAAVLVWENSWSAPFASAVRHAGGQLVASGRIPVQAIIAALDGDSDDDNDEEGA